MNEMSNSSNQVYLSAQELSKVAEGLKQMVEQFQV
jgi:methyl-accepting chemotaxis protein